MTNLWPILEKTVNNVGYWSGTFEGYSLWLGDKSGSRVNQYEAILTIRGCGIEFRARTFSALTKKIIARIKEEKDPII